MNRLDALADTVMRQHVKELAVQAGFVVDGGSYAYYEKELLRFYSMAVLQERTRCATSAIAAIRGTT